MNKSKLLFKLLSSNFLIKDFWEYIPLYIKKDCYFIKFAPSIIPTQANTLHLLYDILEYCSLMQTKLVFKLLKQH